MLFRCLRRTSGSLIYVLLLTTIACLFSVGSVISGAATLTVNGEGTRVTDGQQVLYTFEEGGGTMVNDVSGVGSPLDLSVGNEAAVSWVPGGLVVNASTVIASAGAATKVIDTCRATDELTIEAWIKPANATQDGPARIVTLSAGLYERNFTLGQGLWGSQPSDLYDVRLRTTETDNSGMPSLTTPAGSLTTELSHVVYTRDSSGVARIYIDGVERVSGTVGGDFNWDESYPLALANELTGDRPWLGEFHLVAIYNRALSQAEVTQNFLAGPDIPVPPTVTPTATPLPTATPTPLPIGVYLPIITKSYPESMFEGFEAGVVPPSGWTLIQTNPNQTWELDTVQLTPHSGSYYAAVKYDTAFLDQDELLLSPAFTSDMGHVSLWSFGSLYWCRDTNDNCDLEVWFVNGAWGGGDDVLLGKTDDDWISYQEWSYSTFDFSPYASGNPARIALRYVGNDGAKIGVDDILIIY
jgi:hypothetical protein